MPSRLQGLDRDLWTVDQPQRVAGLDFPMRTTLVRLTDGGLWVHSPGPLAGAPLDAIRALGPVRALVAPNRLHHLHFGAWAEAFPEARRFAAPGLPAKRRDLRFDEVLGDDPPALWAGELAQHALQGMPRLGEIAFLHRASRTLILTDLAFHFRASASGLTRAVLRLNGAWNRFGPSRLLRLLLVRDRAALRGSIERLLSWPFDRVIVAHGEVVPRDGRDRLVRAFAWL